ncbi:MAG: 7-cyano-7-deazaguanine synthase QueC [Bacteroidota bacterium]
MTNPAQKAPKAIVVFSGGLDSTTVLYGVKAQGYQILALTFDYGQRHRIEVEVAKDLCREAGVLEHKIMPLPMTDFGGSSLTSNAMEVPQHDAADIDKVLDANDIPNTYVPARNTLFLSYALAWAEVAQVRDIFVGVNAIDYSGYPDCRPEFIQAFEALANTATRNGVEQPGYYRIHAPLIDLDKDAIIRKGLDLGVDFGLTHSCYNPNQETGAPCGRCDSCLIRIHAFAKLGLTDPRITRYEH